METIREKLREFYQKQHLESLSVRKTASNVLLVEKRDGKKAILVRFSLALGDPCAKLLAEDARCRLAYARSCEDMAKIEHPPEPLPTDAEGMEMPLKDWKPVTAKTDNPLNQFVPTMFDRTASNDKPLE